MIVGRIVLQQLSKRVPDLSRCHPLVSLVLGYTSAAVRAEPVKLFLDRLAWVASARIVREALLNSVEAIKCFWRPRPVDLAHELFVALRLALDILPRGGSRHSCCPQHGHRRASQTSEAHGVPKCDGGHAIVPNWLAVSMPSPVGAEWHERSRGGRKTVSHLYSPSQRERPLWVYSVEKLG